MADTRNIRHLTYITSTPDEEQLIKEEYDRMIAEEQHLLRINHAFWNRITPEQVDSIMKLVHQERSPMEQLTADVRKLTLRISRLETQVHEFFDEYYGLTENFGDTDDVEE